MAKYIIQYQQPYEYDDDSSSGIGDHDIGWGTMSVTFDVETDEEAITATDQFLSEGSVIFEGGTYRRFLDLLAKVVRERDKR